MSDTMIAIGGCHVAGYKVGEENSFVNVVSRSTGYECIHRAANYQIKKTTGIREKINTNQPDIVLLQLGNYEFHASLKQLFQTKKKNKSKLSENSGLVKKSDDTDKQPLLLPLVKEPKAGFFLRNLITPFIWIVLKYRNRLYLKNIKDIIKENPSQTFVILSPIPCFKTSDNLIRNKAAKWYKKLYATLPNVTYIDLFRYIASDKRYFADPGHLNSTGHRIMGRIISQHIKTLKESVQRPVAVAV